ncbi:hypothetical protein D7D26_09665, partial [Pyramidobacter sp. CG50-2]
MFFNKFRLAPGRRNSVSHAVWTFHVERPFKNPVDCRNHVICAKTNLNFFPRFSHRAAYSSCGAANDEKIPERETRFLRVPRSGILRSVFPVSAVTSLPQAPVPA